MRPGRLPAEFEDGLEYLRDAAEQLVAESEPQPKGDSVQAELGFAADPAQRVDVEVVRGNYDVTRLQAKNPKLVNAITFMLGLHFMPHDVIAKACNVSWETVAAVASQRSESIREFKGRMAMWLGHLMDAMAPALLQKIKMGRCEFKDLKFLHEVWAPLAGEASAIVKKDNGLPALKVYEEALRAARQAAPMGLQMGENLPVGGAPSPGVIEAEFVEIGQPDNPPSLVKHAQPVETQRP